MLLTEPLFEPAIPPLNKGGEGTSEVGRSAVLVFKQEFNLLLLLK
jgi:hypothetical protein